VRKSIGKNKYRSAEGNGDTKKDVPPLLADEVTETD
jgi:hypothetical protein